MPATRQDLFARLAALAIETETKEHAAVFTVAESDALHKELPGGHTKNLFLKDAKGRLFLIVAESHAVIDMKTLHKTIGCARLSFGKPDLLMEKLGVTPGSVTAFAVVNDHDGDVTVFIDDALLQYDIINCHPLENTATTAIRREDLVRFLKETGHEPHGISLSHSPDPGHAAA
ncbi:MAG: prolyl-tRNA synthetase associated domain-containing protein [Pseudomonadota bacterium]